MISLGYTPKATNNLLVIRVIVPVYTGADPVTVALFNGGTNALAAARGYATYEGMIPVTLEHTMVARTTGAITFTVREGSRFGAAHDINGFQGIRVFGGAHMVTISVTEVVQ
ncbi:hypothetical protein CCP3SC15_3330001 [Gammaproteobacteria bacterium]